MPARVVAAVPVPQTYAELRRAVELTLVKGQQAVEQARVRTYWDTGRLIHEHVLRFKDRADYGAGAIARLSADLTIHRSTLQRCVQFFLAIPNCATLRNLTWGHYTVLIPIEDPKVRRALAVEADRHAWTVARLKARIAEVAPPDAVDVATISAGEPQDLLKPQRGTPGLHRIVARGSAGRLAVDLGFKVYRMPPEEGDEMGAGKGAGEGAARLRPYGMEEGDIVRLGADGSVRLEPEATKADLFTYGAEVRRVIDGDTLVVAIEVAPEIWLEEKLRLRGLDCPELATPAGKAAKRFVDGLVAAARSVIIRTTKPDKYDRYLADVFLIGSGPETPDPKSQSPDSKPQTRDPKPQTPSPASAAGDIFLNNALLGAGHAVGKDAWEFGDWEAGG